MISNEVKNVREVRIPVCLYDFKLNEITAIGRRNVIGIQLKADHLWRNIEPDLEIDMDSGVLDPRNYLVCQKVCSQIYTFFVESCNFWQKIIEYV